MSMNTKFVIAACCVAMTSVPVAAQEAGDSYAKVAAARTKLVDKGDVFVNGTLDPLAAYSTREAYHGVVTVGHFVIDNFAIEGSFSTPATTNNIPAGSLAGTPNLGDDEFIVGTLGVNFQPFKGKFSPYVGGGIQYQKTTQERDGLAVGLNIPDAHGPYVKAGVDYKVNSKWGIFADVRKAWYHTNATGLLPLDATFTNFANVDAKAELDPLTIQFGVAAHFGKKEAQTKDVAELLSGNKKILVKAGFSNLSLRDRAEMVVGGQALTGEGISTFEHRTPTVQLAYFFNEQIAFNATLGIPPKIDIFAAGTIGGLPKLGEVTYGPTAFTFQYYPKTSGRIRPYVGAGVSYMIVFGQKDGAFQNLKVGNDLAPAFEAGTEILLGKNWGMYFDVKKAFLRPAVTGTFGGANVVTETKLDPWVFGTGISFRL